MNRRDFLGWSLAATGMVFAPKFGRWHRQGSGLLVPAADYLRWDASGTMRVHSWIIYDNDGRIIARGTADPTTMQFTFGEPVTVRFDDRLCVVTQ